MAISKLLLLIIIVVTSVHVGHSSQGGSDPIACVKKLLPCKAYLKGSSPPSAACCVPLRQILGSDRQCLCTLFTDPALMKSLNVTRDDAINLANSCGAHADSSLCKPQASAPSTSTTPTAPSTNSTAAASPPVKRSNAASSVSTYYVGCFLSMAPIFNFIVFAF